MSDLFGDAPPPAEKHLDDPVAVAVVVMRETAKAVLLRAPAKGSAEHWVSHKHLIWAGLGEQQARMERWKAKECSLI